MCLDINLLREFVCVANCLNFTMAAKQLYISQPALTRHINALEEEIGVQLLLRSTHSVELTPVAKTVLADFIDVIDRYNDLNKKLELLTKGHISELRFGTLYYGIVNYYSYPLIKTFRIKFPGIIVTVASCQPSQIIKKLEEKDIDIGLSLHSPYAESAEFVYVPFVREPLYAIVMPTHPFARKRSIWAEELAEQPVIMMKTEIEYEKHIRSLFKQHSLEMKDVILTDHIDTMIMTLEETNAIFIGTKNLSSLPNANVAFIEINDKDFFYDVSLVYRANNRNPAIMKMVECINDLNFTANHKSDPE